MNHTIFVMIGNSDDKLTQAEWSRYFTETAHLLRRWAAQVHGQWASETSTKYQNACWCIEVAPGHIFTLRGALAVLAREFRQESIAWAEGKVEMIEAAS